MCTWLYVRFDCGITIRIDNVWYACEDLKDGTCIGRWGFHEQRVLNMPLPCMDLGPSCELCGRNTLSRSAQFRCFVTSVILVQQELAATFNTVCWELYKQNPHERHSRRTLRCTNSTELITKDLDQPRRRSETPPAPDRLRRGESLPRVTTPCPVPEARRLPSIVPDIERSFVQSQMLQTDPNGSGPDVNKSYGQEAKVRRIEHYSKALGIHC